MTEEKQKRFFEAFRRFHNANIAFDRLMDAATAIQERVEDMGFGVDALADKVFDLIIENKQQLRNDGALMDTMYRILTGVSQKAKDDGADQSLDRFEECSKEAYWRLTEVADEE